MNGEWTTPSTRSRATKSSRHQGTRGQSVEVYASRYCSYNDFESIRVTIVGTNTYLLGTGACRLLLDTGEGLDVWAAAMSSILSSQSANISHALLTHRHKDHVSGVQQVRAMSPRASIHKHSPSHGQVSIQDGQIFQVEGATLHAFHCPGHTSDRKLFFRTMPSFLGHVKRIVRFRGCICDGRHVIFEQ